MSGFIAVHVGAGFFSTHSQTTLGACMKEACKKGQHILQSGGSASDAVTASIAVLEDCQLTNAGIGSCLTNKGTVECDACVMDGRSMRHGAVASVSGVPNPVRLAHRLLLEQTRRKTGNLMPPSLMVGKGARVWGEKRGIPTCEPSILITDKSFNQYKITSRHIRKLKRLERRQREDHQRQELNTPSCGAAATDVYSLASYDKSGCTERLCCGQDGSVGGALTSLSRGSVLPGMVAVEKRHLAGMAYRESCPLEAEMRQHTVKRQRIDETIGESRDCKEECEGARSCTTGRRSLTAENHKLLQSRLDTVGCVAVDGAGHVAAGVSSGGIIYKEPGRVGQSAVFGAGCWAEDDCDSSGANVASSTTGLGEMLVSTQLASNSARLMSHRADPLQPGLHYDLRALFLDNKFLSSYTRHRKRSSGCLLVRHNPLDGSTDLYTFHTTACFGFAYMGAESKRPTINFSSLLPHQEGEEVMLAFHSYYPTSPLPARPLPLVPSEKKQSEDHSCINGNCSAATGLQNCVTSALEKERSGIDDGKSASSSSAATALLNGVTSSCEKRRSDTDGEKSASRNLKKGVNSACEKRRFSTVDEKCVSSACEDDMHSNFSVDKDRTPSEGAPTHCSELGQGSVDRCNGNAEELGGVGLTLDVKEASAERRTLVATKNAVNGAGATGGCLTPLSGTAQKTIGSSTGSCYFLPGLPSSYLLGNPNTPEISQPGGAAQLGVNSACLLPSQVPAPVHSVEGGTATPPASCSTQPLLVAPSSHHPSPSALPSNLPVLQQPSSGFIGVGSSPSALPPLFPYTLVLVDGGVVLVPTTAAFAAPAASQNLLPISGSSSISNAQFITANATNNENEENNNGAQDMDTEEHNE